jgi:hypothetical protein
MAAGIAAIHNRDFYRGDAIKNDSFTSTPAVRGASKRC